MPKSKASNAVEARCAAMRAAKARLREQRAAGLAPREPAWQPPKLRRIVVVIDFDSGQPIVRMMQLLRSHRIDTYRVRSPRGESKKPVGWSRALGAVRKALPRAIAAA